MAAQQEAYAQQIGAQLAPLAGLELSGSARQLWTEEGAQPPLPPLPPLQPFPRATAFSASPFARMGGAPAVTPGTATGHG